MRSCLRRSGGAWEMSHRFTAGIQLIVCSKPTLCFLTNRMDASEKAAVLTESKTENEAERKGDDVKSEERGCQTPTHAKEQIKRHASTDSSQVSDITFSPKRKKQSVGLNPYSRNCSFL